MKIKEVCRKTGLTEKAVRYYVESGLVTPEEYTMRGRTFREYSDEDAEALRSVSTLRRIGLSVDEIRTADRGGAAQVMEGFLQQLGSEVERKQKLLSSLSEADWSDTKNAADLARMIGEATKAEPAPPDFSRFNNSAEYYDDLRAFEERSYEREQHRRRGARAGLIVTAALLFGSVMALTKLIGLLIFIAAAVAAIGLGSDYLGFYRLMCLTGAVTDGICFGLSLSELKNGGLIMQMFSSMKAEPGVMPCLLYLGAAAALLGSFAMLMTNKALTDYLKDRD